MNNPEDSFIDIMALGKLLHKTPEGVVIAGSLEGLIAEVIKVDCVMMLLVFWWLLKKSGLNV